MKKYYFIALILLVPVTLVWCNKTEEVTEIVEPVGIVEELTFEPVKEVAEEENLEMCDTYTVDAYNGKLDISQYPSVMLSKYKYANVTAKFSQNFVDNYRYEDSDQFYFALKIFIWDQTDNGWYYNVLRTRSLSVANWNYLTGAVWANQLKDWFTWTIPLNEDIYLANSEFVEWMQFTKENLSKYISQEKETRIGAYLSSVKELKWWELWDIKIELCM